VLTLVRRAKTEAKISQRADVASLVVNAPAELHAAIGLGAADIADAGSVKSFEVAAAPSLSCDVVLAPTP
jgi:valyl-tRNA synthetase